MVPKPEAVENSTWNCFRAVLFRMVPKPFDGNLSQLGCFRAVLFRMVPKLESR